VAEAEEGAAMLRRLFRIRTLLALASAGLILIGLSRILEIRRPDRPVGTWQDVRALAKRDDVNVVFALVDTLRADRLTPYGYERATSPILDALAATGIRFDHVTAQSTWTKASMASLWTANHPVSTGITRYPDGMPEAAVFPAEILREAGYRTVGIWRNGWLAPNFGFAQGFDLYMLPEPSPNPNARRNNPSSFQLRGTDQDITKAAAAFLRSVRPDERFFLYLHYMDVHQYVYAEGPDFGTSYSDIYDNAIHWVDANLGTLVAHLQRQGLMKRTLLMVASDHGEAFREHGGEGHARNLYVETTRVPFLIVPPVRLEQPLVVRTPVENVDVWPTLLDLLGLPPLPGAQGRSLVPLMEAAARGEEPVTQARPRFAYLDQTWGRTGSEPAPLVAVELDGHRLFVPAKKPGAAELYETGSDPMEQRDLAEAHPELVDRLREHVDAYRNLPQAVWGEPVEVPLSDFELGQLRALGYIVPPGQELEEEEDRTAE
jgi:arylsulfatase A-like enzyme